MYNYSLENLRLAQASHQV